MSDKEKIEMVEREAQARAYLDEIMKLPPNIQKEELAAIYGAISMCKLMANTNPAAGA